MKSNFTLLSILLSFFLSFSDQLSAQAPADPPKLYNTKRNFMMLHIGTGGGDYPFASLGLNLGRHFFDGNTILGIGAHYIGNTATVDWIGIDDVQVFPVMLDIRQKFMESQNGRFSSFVTFDGGYVVSITGGDEDEFGPYEFKNGWAINPGVAFRFNVFNNVGIMADLSWMHHGGPKEWTLIDRNEWKWWDTFWFRGNIFF